MVSTHPLPLPVPAVLVLISKFWQGAAFVLRLVWDFIESDFITFAIPNTSFGVIGAIASATLVDGPVSSRPTMLQILLRLPSVLAFNVGNLLVFDLANQRSPSSVVEDRINKPWRPIPQGRINVDQARRGMLFVIPAVLALDYALGPWKQGVFIKILTWLYNDLGGGDEAFIRELIISVAYGLFNSGSLRVAIGTGNSPSLLGVVWTVIISAVILTTMQVQDLSVIPVH